MTIQIDALDLRSATAHDLPLMYTWLSQNHLPTEDLTNSIKGLYLGEVEGTPVGIGGIERHGQDGLLRSVVIKNPLRHRGYGQTLCRQLIQKAQTDGIQDLYLLTQTAAPFFAKLGFERIERQTAPHLLQQTTQFRSLCPASAICMRLHLKRSGDVTMETISHNSGGKMDPIQCLPDLEIQSAGVISEQFIHRGIQTFQEACLWIQNLPYGANSNSEDSLILFAEMRGTCTTKHGVIARLAVELGLPVYKTLGFYRLNDQIVTGVNEIINPYGLSFIPQIHCFLAYATLRVDLTAGNCNGKNQIIEDYDFVVQVEPDLTLQREQQIYVEYLQQYFTLVPELKQLTIPQILDLLEQCNRQVRYRCSLMAA